MQYWIAQKSFDFYVGGRIVIEVQGSYWHCDNRIYNENDIINIGGEIKLVKDIWERDWNKKLLAEKYDYSVLYLWEMDINNMTDLEILNIITNFKNENS